MRSLSMRSIVVAADLRFCCVSAASRAARVPQGRRSERCGQPGDLGRRAAARWPASRGRSRFVGRAGPCRARAAATRTSHAKASAAMPAAAASNIRSLRERSCHQLREGLAPARGQRGSPSVEPDPQALRRSPWALRSRPICLLQLTRKAKPPPARSSADRAGPWPSAYDNERIAPVAAPRTGARHARARAENRRGSETGAMLEVALAPHQRAVARFRRRSFARNSGTAARASRRELDVDRPRSPNAAKASCRGLRRRGSDRDGRRSIAQRSGYGR